MREILFRSKRVDNGEFVYGYYGEYFNGERNIPRISVADTRALTGSLCYEVVLKSVGQHTGLTAKNGKKIFEGDILDYYGTLYIVSWDDNLLTYIVTSVDEKKEYLFYLNKANMDRVYIVGNVYDNPELLEVR